HLGVLVNEVVGQGYPGAGMPEVPSDEAVPAARAGPERVPDRGPGTPIAGSRPCSHADRHESGPGAVSRGRDRGEPAGCPPKPGRTRPRSHAPDWQERPGPGCYGVLRGWPIPQRNVRIRPALSLQET